MIVQLEDGKVLHLDSRRLWLGNLSMWGMTQVFINKRTFHCMSWRFGRGKSTLPGLVLPGMIPAGAEAEYILSTLKSELVQPLLELCEWAKGATREDRRDKVMFQTIRQAYMTHKI